VAKILAGEDIKEAEGQGSGLDTRHKNGVICYPAGVACGGKNVVDVFYELKRWRRTENRRTENSSLLLK
jgi:hypothetical protein